MGSGNLSKHQDQGDQHGAGRQRIRQKRNRDVSAAESFPHDARPDDGGEQKHRSNRLRDEFALQCNASL
jgi:hypothetical protein